MTENHAPVKLLLCDQAVDGRLTEWLASNLEGVNIQVIADLCGNPGQIGSALDGSDTNRLVLALCSRDVSGSEVQTHARRAGVQPTGLQMVVVGSRENRPEPHENASSAGASIAGAVARARATGDPRPENLKVKLSGFDQQVSRRSLFTLPPVIYETVPTIDESRCVAPDGCDLCVRSCPHGALESKGGRIQLSSSQCRTCGVCVAVCPQRAVELPGSGADEIEAHIQESLLHLPNGQASILFHCDQQKNAASGDWVSVSAPCMGIVSVPIILEALAGGAKEVGLLGCGDYCQSEQSAGAQSRVAFCNQVLTGSNGLGSHQRVKMIDPDDLPAAGEKINQESAPGGQSISGYGPRAASGAILATVLNGQGPVTEHPASPLGIVEIDSTTCTACEACAMACPTGALASSRSDDQISLTFDHSDCVACGRCVEVCPETETETITLKKATDLGALKAGRRTLIESAETLCERCGKPVASRGMLDRIASILGSEFDVQNMERLCVQCRGI
ncbi:MAG: 4Fe-4S binding protein [SAR202 cluster bacterium]|nr:4Fe-4S binding protein [SAR202 cluster bacterium]MDP6716513.1 4Fe-4S binding protein [SAR202 cluster bacterium]